MMVELHWRKLRKIRKNDLEDNYKNRGKNKKPSKNLSSKHILHVTKSVDIALGCDDNEIERNLKNVVCLMSVGKSRPLLS
jgi:hypothetical protein